MGTGGAIGGMIGGAADPAKSGQRNPLQTVGENDPGVMLAQLNDASKAAMTLPQPDAEPLLAHLDSARAVLNKRLGVDPNYGVG